MLTLLSGKSGGTNVGTAPRLQTKFNAKHRKMGKMKLFWLKGKDQRRNYAFKIPTSNASAKQHANAKHYWLP